MEKKKKILIVEDEAAQVLAIKTVLTDAGYDVVVATDGVAGLEAIIKEHPDLIILDIRLPKMNGLEVLSRMKQNSTVKDIPAIILTNLTSEDEITRAKTLGAIDYLVKTQVHTQDLIRKINKSLGLEE